MNSISAISIILGAGRDLTPPRDFEPGRERPARYADLYVAGVVEHYGHYVQIYFGFDGGQKVPVVAGIVEN